MNSAAIASRFARYIALPIVGAGVILGITLGLAGTAAANPSSGPSGNDASGPRTAAPAR